MPTQHQTETKASQLETTKPQAGCDVLVAALEKAGVTTIFAYPGGASMEIHHALTRSKQIRTILPRHEQGGGFAAEGYARSTGKPGVCMATSGPGATNLVTAIADAYMDSCPLIAITGQVNRNMIGRGAFQETDVIGMTLPIVKHSYLIMDAHEIPHVIQEAFHIATSGRPGPVVIDIPKDVQQQLIKPDWTPVLPSRKIVNSNQLDPLAIAEILGLLANAERPVIYCGGGIISSDASSELIKFAEKTNIPVTTTLMGIGAFPEEHQLSLRWLGMHGAAFANWAVNGEYEYTTDPNHKAKPVHAGADLLLAIGARFDDRVTGRFESFCQTGTIVHIDIDASEINKNRRVHLGVQCDAKTVLQVLNQQLTRQDYQTPVRHGWLSQIATWKNKAPFAYKLTPEIKTGEHMQLHLDGREDQIILQQEAIKTLYDLIQGNAIITTGVGQHQMWAAQWFKFKHPRQFITSGGLGSMGFGFPAAIGAKVAFPDKQVIDIDGDGSFLMNIQELATAHAEKIAVKAMILNNQHLGMVVQWEDKFYQGNRGHTFLGKPEDRGELYPDYVTACKAFGVKCERVMFKRDLIAAITRMLEAEEPYILDIIVPYTTQVLPFIPAGQTVANMIWKS